MAENLQDKNIIASDPTAESRKQDHIDLAFRSQVDVLRADGRFYYEPLLAGFSDKDIYPQTQLLGKTFRYPMWISSMTGGNKMAGKINENLARVCNDFGLGFGLGSCRQLLTDHTYLKDFDVRKYLGDRPFYANLGVAQIEELLINNKVDEIIRLVDLLKADGILVHVNPLQEWSQPEGNLYTQRPIETIEKLLEKSKLNIIVKEVGQGMGKKSLEALVKLPLAAIDFAAFGGTNFSKLELYRNPEKQKAHEVMSLVGHTAEEMVSMVNEILSHSTDMIRCREFIVSGGIRSYLDGYYLTRNINAASIYGQASGFLKHAMEDYDQLYRYVKAQTEGLELANTFLTIKE